MGQVTKKRNSKRVFKKKDWVVYPAHGVGKITGIEEQEIAGEVLELYVVLFEREKMILRVPLEKVGPLGMRKLSTKGPNLFQGHSQYHLLPFKQNHVQLQHFSRNFLLLNTSNLANPMGRIDHPIFLFKNPL
jgi:hypothetical protein